MKINELLAKINTVVFYVLSAPEYNHHDFGRKKRKWRRNRSENFFFRDYDNFGRKKRKWRRFFFFIEITIILGEKNERQNQSLFLENTNFWKFLPQAPEFEYPPLIMKINIFRDYCNAARK